MTTVYFVRHAKPDYSIHDDLTRPLLEEGKRDREKVTTFLEDKNVNVVYSSPYLRAKDTIAHFAEKNQLSITLVDDLRERRIDSEWIEDFAAFAQKQWEDFSYKLSDGECLQEVQQRNVAAFQKILSKNQDQTIVIGTHGTAMSTIINYYNPTFLWDDFKRIANIMPIIVKMTFENTKCIEINEYIV